MFIDNILFGERIKELYTEAKKLSSKTEYEDFMNSLPLRDREEIITYTINKYKSNLRIGVPDEECESFYEYIISTDSGRKGLNAFSCGSVLPIALTLLVIFLYLIIKLIFIR